MRMLTRGYVPGYTSGGLIEAKAVSYSMKNPVWIIYLTDGGEPIILDATNLISILKESDKELLNLFQQQNDLEDLTLLREYVLKYNERNSGK